MTRVIVIALDGADPGMIDRGIREGRLPHLARLRARAAEVPIRSAVAYRSEFPWSEFTTGLRADTLRYWGTVDFEPGTYDAYMRGATTAEPFYAFGDAATVVAFDLPKVIRTLDVHGVQMLGWGAHSPQYPLGSLPEGLYEEVLSRFGPNPAMALEYAGSWHQPDHLDRFGAAQADATRARGPILQWMAEANPDWSLLMTLVGETHQTGHLTTHGFEGLLTGAPSAPNAATALHAVYRAVDDLVGDMVAWAPPDAVVMVLSVNGMTTADDEAAASLAPELLLRDGVGERRMIDADLDAWRRRGAPPVVPALDESPIGWLHDRIADPNWTPDRSSVARARVRTSLERIAPGLLRARRRLLHREHPLEVDGVRPDRFPYRDHSMNNWHPAAWYRDAWPRLPAFALPSFSDLHVRINLEGRERDGIVPLGDYAAACARVEALLASTLDARTGASLVEDVWRVRADDPVAPDGPETDLVFKLRGTDAVEHAELGSLGPVAIPRTGGHTEHGFAFLAGPTIAPGLRPSHPIRDLSATVAALVAPGHARPLDGTPIDVTTPSPTSSTATG